jgi:predicted nucleic acid-binding protein
VILLDTNLLARLTTTNHPHGSLARQAITALLRRGERLVIVPQNLYEFWAVATRRPGPAPSGQNGLGFNVAQASQWIGFFRRRFALLPDRPDLPDRWHELVSTNAITGFRSHDARLVAAMQCYGVSRLLTFNGADFQKLGVAVIDPAAP